MPKVQEWITNNPQTVHHVINVVTCGTELTEKQKKEIYDSFTDGKNLTIFDYDIMPNVIYKYSVIPYYISNGKTFYGEEIYSNKVKSSKIIFDDDLLDILYND